jgi:outer membrane biosynthesis protein TonB
MKKVLVGILTLFSVWSPIVGCAAKQGTMIVDPVRRTWPEAAGTSAQNPPRVINDSVFGAWIAHHERILRRLREDTPIKKGTICQVTVSKEGVLSDVKIDKTSGSEADDKAALDLLTKAGPFRPIPSAAEPPTFLVEFCDSPTVRFTRIKADQ